MADKKVGEEDVRKIMRTGKDGASYAVTLPKAIVKELEWKEKQKVVITRDGDRVIIEDWEE